MQGLSKETRIKIFIFVDFVFFLIELSLGYASHSLALVADAFHMWARAEILGGLVNGVFLIALCMTIFLEAIQRFYDPQEVENPKLVLIVGGIGLAFNILGLFVFHQHSHSHGDEESGDADGHSHAHTHDEHTHSDHTDHQHSHSVSWDISNGKRNSGVPTESSPVKGRASHSRRSISRSYGPDDIPSHPSLIRDSIISQARATDEDSEEAVDEDDPNENTPLIKAKSNTRPQLDSRQSHKHHNHETNLTKGNSGGHGHSHDMNMRGMFLHVLGDALGNVGVMASALIIWLSAPWPYRFYFDPIISLFITAIILKSAIPLVKETAKPLLQAVPEDISVEDIKADIELLDGVESCHHLHVWALTPSKRIATLDVRLSFDFNIETYMVLAKEMKRCLHAYGIHSSTIQPEFFNGQGAAEAICQLECGDGREDAKKCCGTGDVGSDGAGSAQGDEGAHDHAGHEHAGHDHAGHEGHAHGDANGHADSHAGHTH